MTTAVTKRLPFWCPSLARIRVNSNALVHSTTSPTYLAADLFVLLPPTVCPWLTIVANRAWYDLLHDVTSA